MLILVRHSAVQRDPQKPSRTWPLSPDDRSRRRTFVPRLRPYQPYIFITSDEPKAQETGQILAAELGVAWQTAANLHEHDRTGAPFLSSKAEFTAQIADFPQIEPLSFWQALTQPAAIVVSWPQKRVEEQLLYTAERPSS